MTPIVAAAISLAIFTWTHLGFFGTGWLITSLPGTIALYVLFLWRKNLWACILMHFTMDIPIFIMAVVTLVR